MREFDNRRRAHFWGVSRVDGRESGWERWLRERPRLSRLVAASSAPQLGSSRGGQARLLPIPPNTLQSHQNLHRDAVFSSLTAYIFVEPSRSLPAFCLIGFRLRVGLGRCRRVPAGGGGLASTSGG